VNRVCASATLLLLVAVWTGRARAAADSVELSLHGCPDISDSALREHLAIELKTLGLDRVVALFSLHCEGDTASIELRDRSGARYPIASRVELRETARGARERLLALAASELLAQAERTEHEPARERASTAPAPTPSPAPAPARDTAPATVKQEPGRRHVELSLAGSGMTSGQPRAFLWGGVLGARWGVRRGWSVVLDTQLARGRESLPLTDVRWTMLCGFAGGALATELGPLRVSAALGVRAGWLTLAAEAKAPNSGRSMTAPWAGAALPLRVAFDTGAALSPFVAAEAGYVTLPVRGRVEDGPLLVEQRGPWLGGSVGLAVEL
jgi:hypothetical protein